MWSVDQDGPFLWKERKVNYEEKKTIKNQCGDKNEKIDDLNGKLPQAIIEFY